MMNYPANQLTLMSTEDPQTRFWANCYGMSAQNHAIFFAYDFMRRYGTHALAAEIHKRIIQNNTSLLVIELTSLIFDPFLIADLKAERGLMVVIVTMDDEYQFDWISATYATISDLVLTTDYVSVDRYRQAGVRAEYFTLPIFVPETVPPQCGNGPKYDVSFVGRIDAGKPSRAEFARFLAQRNIPVSYFTSSGSRDSSYLSRDAMYEIFRDSAINLNFSGITTAADDFNNALYQRIRGMKIRPLEIMAAGGFCLSEHAISLERLFTDGVDIAFFRSKEDLVRQIDHFRGHPTEAKDIAAKGASRVRDEFSGDSRGRIMADQIRAAHPYVGVDLYGEPQRLQVSMGLAHSFISFSLATSVALLFHGQFRAFSEDLALLVRFVKRLSADAGGFSGLRLASHLLYRLAREMLRNTRALISGH